MLLIELDAPFEEQLELHLHGMDAGFHDDKLALGHGFQFIRRQQRSLNHLQRLGRIVLTS